MTTTDTAPPWLAANGHSVTKPATPPAGYAPDREQVEAAPAAPADDDREQPAPLTPGWVAMAVGVALLTAGIALGGMGLSFEAVSTSMRPAFHAWAWVVPLVVDLTVFAFSGVDLILTRLDMSHPLPRWIVYGATAGTVFLNYSAGGNLAARVAHVAMPSVWVAFIEVMRHIVRRQTNLATGSHREPIPAARWWLAPWPTFKLWRRMVLWRCNSYRTALEMERRRLGCVAVARREYGARWRRRLDPLTAMQISYGEADPVAVRAAIRAALGETTEQPTRETTGQPTEETTQQPMEQPTQRTTEQPTGQTTRRPTRRPTEGQTKAQKAAQRVRDYATEHPEQTYDDLAKRFKVSPRTAKRYITGN